MSPEIAGRMTDSSYISCPVRWISARSRARSATRG